MGGKGQMALPDEDNSKRAYDKGNNSKACGWGARGASQACRALGQKLRDFDHRRPRGLAGEGRCGSPKEGRISQSSCLTRSSQPETSRGGEGGGIQE